MGDASRAIPMHEVGATPADPRSVPVEFNPPVGGGGPASVSSADITDATATGRSVLTAADAAAARTAIGAGTSSITIGTSASTAAAGNHTQAATTVNVAADATNGIVAGTAQVVISALAARIKALEDAAP